MGMFGDAFRKFATPDNLYLLGAGLKDASAGGSENLTAAQTMMTKRRELEQKRQLGQRAAGLFGSGAPNFQDPDVQRQLLELQNGGYDVSPMLEIAKAGQAPKQQYIEGPDGIYAVGADGPKLSMKYPEKPPSAPSGMTFGADGKLSLIPGYADAVGQITGTRRDAVVSRPMPRKAGGGAHPGFSGLPAGFVPD